MLEIAQLGQPVLRQVAEEITAETLRSPEFHEFLGAMFATLESAHGVGLAAPQVFVSVRVFLAAVGPPLEPECRSEPEVFINPRLTILSDEMTSAWEGCLSFQELLVQVPRYRALRLDYLDAQGLPRSRVLEDLAARIVQHEYDHLDGILTIDRAASTRDIIKASEIEAVLPADEGESG